jgi:hypothetical protein
MNTQLTTLSEIKTSEYKLMYMFGAWVTAEVIIAECDKEAIFDATEHASKLADWKHGVALFRGNRLVHRFN